MPVLREATASRGRRVYAVQRSCDLTAAGVRRHEYIRFAFGPFKGLPTLND